MRASRPALWGAVLGSVLFAAGCTAGSGEVPEPTSSASASQEDEAVGEREPITAAAPIVTCTDVANDQTALQDAVLALLVESFDPARVEEVVYYTANICSWDESAGMALVDALTATNLVSESDLRADADGDGGAGESPSDDERHAWEAGTEDQERIWETCYAPAGYAAQVNTNPEVIDEVLSDYPDLWLANVPVPDAQVLGVCHQHIPIAGVKDVWWVSFQDPAAGYEAALAWDAQLIAAGAERYCQRELSEGPDGTYSCAYSVAGYDALISNSKGNISLNLQPGL
jgi:hypothetical protein